jgi:superfamily I DNA and/or RNA helicase
MVVIDEASQATEPATLVPLTRGAHCAVLAGDPCQLPPTIVSDRARRECGLDVTLFERCARAAAVGPGRGGT